MFVKRKMGKPKAQQSLHRPSNHIRNLQAKKLRLWHLAKDDPTYQEKYNKCTDKISREQQHTQVTNEMRVINSGSLGSLYNHINSRLTHKSSIAPLIDSSGSIVADDFKKVDLLNEHLVNIGTHDNGFLPTLKRSNLMLLLLKVSILTAMIALILYRT